ncbi:C40 family peptidase [Marinobacterium sp. CAU 1594]|nr:C40 family peptidase [Marinobacterium arenosum]
MGLRSVRVGLLLIICALVTACGGLSHKPASYHYTASPDSSPVAQALYDQHLQWRGTPYELGGTDRSGIDCSAFTQRTFLDQFGTRLPRTTARQQYSGQPVPRQQLQPGDLVFFKTSRKVRHVGIYIERNRFLHASTSNGVMISNLNNPYWQTHYWKAVRPMQPLSVSQR